MEKVGRVVHSFEAAEASDIEEDMRIPREKRIEILLELQCKADYIDLRRSDSEQGNFRATQGPGRRRRTAGTPVSIE